MGESKIIVFANQKGGVGKSSLCMAFANYLSTSPRIKETGIEFGGVIDTDYQRTIIKQREQDMKNAEGTELKPMYNVISFNLDNYNGIPSLINRLRNSGKYYLIDTPGRLDHKGITTLLMLADFIVCPFRYDTKTIASTTKFLLYWQSMMARIENQNCRQLNTKMILVPNHIDNRTGNKKEKDFWNAVNIQYSKIGILTDRITYMADMGRINTLSWVGKQQNLVENAFETIINYLTDKNL